MKTACAKKARLQHNQEIPAKRPKGAFCVMIDKKTACAITRCGFFIFASLEIPPFDAYSFTNLAVSVRPDEVTDTE